MEPVQTLENGEISVGFQQADNILEGMIEVGGQDHFYTECMACVVSPSEKGGVDVIATTQEQTLLQVGWLV